MLSGQRTFTNFSTATMNLTIATEDANLSAEAYAKKEEAKNIQQRITDGKLNAFVENGFELTIGHINDTHSHLDSETMSLYFDDVKTKAEVGFVNV
jgi:hypothetical protein